MGERTKISSSVERWSGWLKLLGAVISLAGLLGFSGFFYERIWASKVLAYTLLPTYELTDQAFSGIVVENRGRVSLTDVQVVFADLEAPILALNMPGAHEPAAISAGGPGAADALIEIPRLSKEATISIYMLTTEAVKLEEGRTLFVSSNETVGVVATTAEQSEMQFARALAAASVLVGLIGVGSAILLVRRSKVRISRLRKSVEQLEKELASFGGELPGRLPPEDEAKN